MKNKASAITLLCFVLGLSYFFFYFGVDFYLSGKATWETGLKKADSLENIASLRQGKAGRIFLDVEPEENRPAAAWGVPMRLKFHFKSSSDSVFNLGNNATIMLNSNIRQARIKFITNPKTKEFDVIEFWWNDRKYFSAIDYLKVEKPLYGVSVFLIVAGCAFGAIGIYAFRFIYRFIVGWIKLSEDIKMKYIEKKKASSIQLMLMRQQLKRWDDAFILQVIVAVIMTFAFFLIPTKFFGIREMLQHARDGSGNQSMAEAIGYVKLTIGLAFIASLYIAEYLLGRQALKRDLAHGDMVTKTGTIKGIFRDKKDGNQLKATIAINKMEFEEIELTENHTFKKGQLVNVDLALQSLQVIGITHADSSRSGLSVR